MPIASNIQDTQSGFCPIGGFKDALSATLLSASVQALLTVGKRGTPV